MQRWRRPDRLPADGSVAAGDTFEVGAIDDTLAATCGELVDRDLAAPKPDADLAISRNTAFAGTGSSPQIADPREA